MYEKPSVEHSDTVQIPAGQSTEVPSSVRPQDPGNPLRFSMHWMQLSATPMF